MSPQKNSQLSRLKRRIPLVVVAVVDAFHIDLAAMDIVGQGSF